MQLGDKMSSRELGMHCRHPPVIPAFEAEAGEGGVGVEGEPGEYNQTLSHKTGRRGGAWG